MSPIAAVDDLALALIEHASRGRRVRVVGKLAHCERLFDRLLVVGPRAERASRSARRISYLGGGDITWGAATVDGNRGFSAHTLCFLEPISDKARTSAVPVLMGAEEPVTIASHAFAGVSS